MDVAFFQLKRAFQSSVNFARRALAEYGLTPARFDLLYAVYRGCAGHNIDQCALVSTLGVKSSTTSRMLTSLEKLALVRRERLDCDKRRNRISLTFEGHAALARVLLELIETGDAKFAVHRAVVARWWSARARRFESKRFAMFLFQIREAFGDVGSLDENWFPYWPLPKRRRARYVHVGKAPPTPRPWMSHGREHALDAWRY